MPSFRKSASPRELREQHQKTLADAHKEHETEYEKLSEREKTRSEAVKKNWDAKLAELHENYLKAQDDLEERYKS